MSYQPSPIKKTFHAARRFLAKHWLSLQPALQIALTGSQGKTNTTYVLSKVLASLGNTVVTDINLDTIYNVPITALHVMPWTKFAVFELGIDHPKEMDLHLEIVKPTIALITGIAPVHTDAEHLGSLENLVKEKQKLIETLSSNGYAVLNYDDRYVCSMAPYTKAKIIWYGTDKKNCDVYVDPKSVKLSLKGTSFQLVSTRFNQSQSISTRLIGKHHIYTVMAVIAVLKAMRKSMSLKILETIEPLPGRMSVEKGPVGTVILNDSLRANPASTKSGLETFSEISYTNGRKIAVLAEMGELEMPKEEHAKIIELIKTLKIDFIITIGDSYPESSNIFHAKDVFEGAKILKKVLKQGDFIYLKGSLYKGVARVLDDLI